MAHIDPHQPPFTLFKAGDIKKDNASIVSSVAQIAHKALALQFSDSDNETTLLKPTQSVESDANTDTKIESLARPIFSRESTVLRYQAQSPVKSRLKDLQSISSKDFEKLSLERQSEIIKELIRDPALQPVIIRLIPQLKSKEVLESVFNKITQAGKELSLSVYLSLTDNSQKKYWPTKSKRSTYPFFLKKFSKPMTPFLWPSLQKK
jgi:hypothetical protein